MMPRRFIGLAAVILVGSMASAARVGSGASAATPTPAATSTASATPLPADTLRIVVFNDLNGDGLADPGEPGLASWNISQGCSDALRQLITDAKGEATTEFFGGADVCLNLDREFGWLPTRNNVHARVPHDWNTEEPFIFALHYYGPTVMELRGEAISDGLPMMQGVPGIEEPFRSCGHLFFESVGPSATNAVVIVEGADARAGCPRLGDNIVPSPDGAPPTPAPAVPFSPGTTATTSWVADGDSMRFYSSYITDAWVFDVAAGLVTKRCAAIRDVSGGLIPPGFARVFVLSDRTRPGCGASGRMVRLFRNGMPLAPDVEWRAGDVSGKLPQFEVAPVSPPNTGSGGLLGGQPHRAPGTTWPVVDLAIAVAVVVLRRSEWRRR